MAQLQGSSAEYALCLSPQSRMYHCQGLPRWAQVVLVSMEDLRLSMVLEWVWDQGVHSHPSHLGYQHQGDNALPPPPGYCT